MKRLHVLAWLAALLPAACVTQSPLPAYECATPADEAAAADITMTAQDAVIEAAPGVFFHAWTYDGDVPGPVLRIPLGETRTIKLRNDSPRPASLHFHGVSYAETDDGTSEHPESIVNPGCAHIYTVEAVQPGVWPYHSHVEPRSEMAMGLHGAIVVPDPAEAAADHEYFVYLGQLGLEEGEEGGEEEEEGEGAGGEVFYMTINGRPGTAQVIELQGSSYVVSEGMADAQVGDLVRWRVVSVSPDDVHTFHLHGHRWCDRGGVMVGGECPAGTLPTDNEDIFPAQGITFEFVEDAPGHWMMHCHIVDHVIDGMMAMYHVDP